MPPPHPDNGPDTAPPEIRPAMEATPGQNFLSREVLAVLTLYGAALLTGCVISCSTVLWCVMESDWRGSDHRCANQTDRAWNWIETAPVALLNFLAGAGFVASRLPMIDRSERQSKK